MTPAQKLVDEIRDLQAQAAGKQVELCMLLGDREGAERAQREMYALIEARQAAAYAQHELNAEGCFFLDQAERDLPGLLRRHAA
tara:strand:- start:518 stop:769 length:252 start_codon:yes stop_codon:yes gene_type:complete